MKNLFGLAVLALVVSLTGCGGGPSPEGMMRESVAIVDKLASAMESAKDADEAAKNIESFGNQLKDLKSRFDAQKVTKDKEKELEKKLEPEMKKAQEHLGKAMVKFANPADMEKIGKALGKALEGFGPK